MCLCLDPCYYCTVVVVISPLSLCKGFLSLENSCRTFTDPPVSKSLFFVCLLCVWSYVYQCIADFIIKSIPNVRRRWINYFYRIVYVKLQYIVAHCAMLLSFLSFFTPSPLSLVLVCYFTLREWVILIFFNISFSFFLQNTRLLVRVCAFVFNVIEIKNVRVYTLL